MKGLLVARLQCVELLNRHVNSLIAINCYLTLIAFLLLLTVSAEKSSSLHQRKQKPMVWVEHHHAHQYSLSLNWVLPCPPRETNWTLLELRREYPIGCLEWGDRTHCLTALGWIPSFSILCLPPTHTHIIITMSHVSICHCCQPQDPMG